MTKLLSLAVSRSSLTFPILSTKIIESTFGFFYWRRICYIYFWKAAKKLSNKGVNCLFIFAINFPIDVFKWNIYSLEYSYSNNKKSLWFHLDFKWFYLQNRCSSKTQTVLLIFGFPSYPLVLLFFFGMWIHGSRKREREKLKELPLLFLLFDVIVYIEFSCIVYCMVFDYLGLNL